MIAKEKKKWISKLKHKYRLIIRDESTLEEKASFKLTRFNVITFSSTALLILMVGVSFLIAYTSLRQYIPGYGDFNTIRKFSGLDIKTDSLERVIRNQEEYLANIKNILTGNVEQYSKSAYKKIDTFELKKKAILTKKTKEDSILRAEIEKEESFNVLYTESNREEASLKSLLLFPPIKGVITEKFNVSKGHPAIDIAANLNEGVKAVLDGTVVFADWNIYFGYVIIIQHDNNLLSCYKHNSTLLKKSGNFVRSGEVIAIVGETGELSNGPHLHFELWYNGNPIDPEKYIVF